MTSCSKTKNVTLTFFFGEYQPMMARAQEFIDQGSSGGLGPIFALAYPLTPLQVLEETLISLLYCDCQQ